MFHVGTEYNLSRKVLVYFLMHIVYFMQITYGICHKQTWLGVYLIG